MRPASARPAHAYAYRRDLEKGLSSSSPSAFARRCLPTKKTRWALIIVCGLIAVYHFSNQHSDGDERRHDEDFRSRARHDTEHLEDIWDDKPPAVQPKGWNKWGIELPFGGGHRGPPVVMEDKDEERIGSGGIPPDHRDQAKLQPPSPPKPFSPLGALSWIEPMHPDLSILPDPSELLPEIKLPEYFHPPVADPFPSERIREIISPPPVAVETGVWHVSESAFSHQWVPPDEWDDPKPMRRVQWEGFAGGRDRWESDAEKEVREERRDAVRRGFAFAWQSYKDNAWGMCTGGGYY